jgi:hypothetical protein
VAPVTALRAWQPAIARHATATAAMKVNLRMDMSFQGWEDARLTRLGSGSVQLCGLR